MNATSSRSHSCFIAVTESRKVLAEDPTDHRAANILQRDDSGDGSLMTDHTDHRSAVRALGSLPHAPPPADYDRKPPNAVASYQPPKPL